MLKSVWGWLKKNEGGKSRGRGRGRGDAEKFPSPKIIPQQEHGILLAQISPHAVKAIQRLQKSGFAAYVVGGAVRDLIRGLRPKDFDVATSASPTKIRRLFGRNARVIGRRFPIVHLYYANEIVEVSTFRANRPTRSCRTSGRILHDNSYGGSESDDARRRDFTVNALLYDPLKQTVIDYVGGFADIRRHRLRMIGDPVERYREDPVRILRAARFAAKLGFKIEPATESAIAPSAKLLGDIPSPRLFDELAKGLSGGSAVVTFKELRRFGLLSHLLPHMDKFDNRQRRFIDAALVQSDLRAADSRAVSLSFLIAALFWPAIAERWRESCAVGRSSQAAMERVFSECGIHENEIIPRRLQGRAQELWLLQARLADATAPRRISPRRRIFSALANSRFRPALAFLNLRTETGDLIAEKSGGDSPLKAGTAKWWNALEEAKSQPAEATEKLLSLLPEKPPDSGRRRPRAQKQAA